MTNTNIKSRKVASLSSNIINYQLSNHHYIKLGWTIKPTTRLARRIFLYETKMTKSHLNWPKLFKGTKYYSNNLSPFIIHQDNSTTVFYPDGKIAIKVVKPVEKNYDVYMVFKSTEKDDIEIIQERHEMIAAFDTLGNGLILNENDGIRLTFNQIGGICFDKRVALAPFTWTWSRSNVKPIMEAVYIEAAATRLAKVLGKNLRSTSKSSADRNTQKTVGSTRKKSPVVNIPLLPSINHRIIGRNGKLLPIKTVCLKINNFISLRILDRRNINLQFFAGNRSIRTELGFDVIFNKPLKSFLDDPSWGPKGFFRCRFDNEFVCNWINSKKNIFESMREYEKGDDK